MKYYVSCTKFTCFVETENNIIIYTAPILSRFIGQKFDNLKYWIRNWNPHIEEYKN